MEFSDEQVRQLKAKLDAKSVKTRYVNGSALNYVEGWHAIAEANRIFGFDAWDRRTICSTRVHSERSGRIHFAAYVAKVRVSVRAGKITIVREGSGMGEGVAPTPGQAHELALKGAETDATKRALATFGNPFGLALYDREQAGVRKARLGKDAVTEHNVAGPWTVLLASGALQTTLKTPNEFAAALRQAMTDAQDIEVLFAIWKHNVDTVRAIARRFKKDSAYAAIAQGLVAHLKACATNLKKSNDDEANLPVLGQPSQWPR
jgi:recombination DNA repair RAD52 pathway protein